MGSSEHSLPIEEGLNPDADFYHNVHAQSWSTGSPSTFSKTSRFHHLLPKHSPTPLAVLPALISTPLGLDGGRVYLKDESNRLGLSSFKILGASWAICNALAELLNFDLDGALTKQSHDSLRGANIVQILSDLVRQYTSRLNQTPISPREGEHASTPKSSYLELVAATEGNHGRAVAHMAHILDIPARIFVPTSVSPASRRLIEAEGISSPGEPSSSSEPGGVKVVVVDGDYDEAVRCAENWCSEDGRSEGKLKSRILIQDTIAFEDKKARPRSSTFTELSIPENRDVSQNDNAKITQWIVDGYATLFAEIDDQLASIRGSRSDPLSLDAIVVPCGAGSFAQGAVRYFRSTNRNNEGGSNGPVIILVESADTPSLLTSLKQGTLTTIPSPSPAHAHKTTVMAGLNCPTTSSLAWPDLRAGADIVTAVTDEEALKAMDDLINLEKGSLDVGPCGAASLAALRKLSLPSLTPGSESGGGLARFGLNERSTIVLVSTEGGEMYRAALGDDSGGNELAAPTDSKVNVNPSRFSSLLSKLNMHFFQIHFTESELTDPVALAQALVRIASPNPELSRPPPAARPTSPNQAVTFNNPASVGPVPQNEVAIAKYVASWLSYQGFEVHRLQKRLGSERPSIVGVARGSYSSSAVSTPGDKPKSIMFNGHIDTVSLEGYVGDPLSGELRGDELHGRGSYDMKAGLAAMLIAASNATGLKGQPNPNQSTDLGPSTKGSLTSRLRGDVIVACVSDEEYASQGTAELLEAGWGTTTLHADGAIIPEPSDLTLFTAHQGFVWFEVDILGVAAHGSRADLGVDAIVMAGHFLVALGRYAEELKGDTNRGTVHAGMIQGGQEPSTYPAKCTITIERRTVQGETPESVREEIESILHSVADQCAHDSPSGGQTVSLQPRFNYELRTGMSRPPFAIAEDHPFIELVQKCGSKAIGRQIKCGIGLFWADSALLMEAGIPSVLFGPEGSGAHAATEWASVRSVRQLTEALTEVATEFCQ